MLDAGEDERGEEEVTKVVNAHVRLESVYGLDVFVGHDCRVIDQDLYAHDGKWRCISANT